MPLTILTRRTRGGSCPTPRPTLACRPSASRLSENLARAVSRHPSKSDWPPTEWSGWNVSLRLGIAIAKARVEALDIAIQSKSARARGKNNSRRSDLLQDPRWHAELSYRRMLVTEGIRRQRFELAI
jgi:hypothetical protein